MSLYISSLNSGSNGNAYYVGSETEAVLIDAGISCKEIEKRLARLTLEIRNIKAVFISHEHSDHISGLRILVSKYGIPVYASRGTASYIEKDFDKEMIRLIEHDSKIEIGGLSVHGFRKKHDAVDPLSFTVSSGNTTIGIFTDIGSACENVTSHFKKCHAAFLESNYDEAMLQTGKYPQFLKNRISGDLGHLSNRQALEIFKRYRHHSLEHIILSHLSKENNCPNLVKETFEEIAGNTKVTVASREKETPLINISNQESIAGKPSLSGIKAVQTSLF